jgi:hypothetical protein
LPDNKPHICLPKSYMIVAKPILTVYMVISNTRLWCINISYSLVSIWTAVFRFYSVAVMTRAFPDYSGNRQDLVLLQNIACYLLLSCGVVYIFSVRLLNRETIVPIQKLFYYAFFPKSWFVNTTWQTVSPMMILNNSFKTIWFVFLCANYIHVII